jgi:hypothetical protein
VCVCVCVCVCERERERDKRKIASVCIFEGEIEGVWESFLCRMSWRKGSKHESENGSLCLHNECNSWISLLKWPQSFPISSKQVKKQVLCAKDISKFIYNTTKLTFPSFMSDPRKKLQKWMIKKKIEGWHTDKYLLYNWTGTPMSSQKNFFNEWTK